MATQRKFLLIGRHGKSRQQPEGIDALAAGAVRELYETVGVSARQIVTAHRIPIEGALLAHTPAERTRQTARAVAVGAYDLRPSEGGRFPPQDPEDLEKYGGLAQITTTRDERFAILKPGINKRIYLEAGTAAPNIDYLLQNRLATKHEESTIESLASLQLRHVRGLRDVLNWFRYYPREKDLGIIAAHGAYTEVGLLIPLIETAGRKVTAIEEIGGPINTGEFAQLTMEVSRSGSPSAKLEYKGQSHPVDLGKL